MRLTTTLLLLMATANAIAGEPSRAPEQRAAIALAAPAMALEAEERGGLSAYVRTALRQSPEVRAAYASWDAEVRSIRGAGAPPEPTLGLGLFVQSVQTRVGPQQARLSIQQTLPWPTALVGRRDAAVAEARAAQARFEAVVLTVSAKVHRGYWTLWEVRETRLTHRAHLEILDDLSTTLRARLEVGGATLADLQQVDLSRARLEDSLLSLDAQERRAMAALRATLGDVLPAALPTVDSPLSATVPEAELEQVIALALAHPDLDAMHAREEGAAAGLRVARSQRAPGLSIGADWVLTGPAVDPTLPGSGKDALMLGFGLRLPLWRAATGDDIRSAQATEQARDLETEAVRVQVHAQVEDAYIRVTDGARRVGVVRGTLLPQAHGTTTSLLGSYAVGSATVAQVLLAQRDLLDLQILLDQQRAGQERAWADLEQLAGAALARRRVETTP